MQPLFPSQGVKPRQVGSPGPKSIFPAPPLPKPATGSPKRVEPKIEPRVDTGGSSATKAQELAARIQQASINRASSVKKVKDLAAKLVVHAERQEEIRNRTMKKLEDVSQRLNKEQPDALGAPPTPQAKEQADARQRQAGDAVPELSSGVERAKSLASRLIEQVERQDNLCSKALSKLEEYADKLKQPVPSVRPVSVPAPPAPAAAAAPGLGALAAAGTHAAAPAGDGLLPLPLGMMTVDVQAAVRARIAAHGDPVPATAALAQEINAQAAARLAAAAALRRLPLGVSLPSQPGVGVGVVGGVAGGAAQQPVGPAAGAAPAASTSNVVPAPSAQGPRHSEQSPAEAAAAAPVPAGAQAAQQQPQPGALTDTPQAEAEAAYAPGVVRA
ncbi:hypothetical protein CHLRE_06g277600v5 [Chlamydomonas reinhardtii]|uniref:Uncharacterized protein n=1 Tax=Chlamydomonas reinhardtii TaxID=3055 RepID=A0A2K3DNR9_CHLRE|nr:uncharacterized protein CHLRE_06g277600v5 [Chlamydomonas reinhardtii]PNW82184.1 hypothetical protein CHLRE_06g277600v5 [Chlamydomonas reinhardtii]